MWQVTRTLAAWSGGTDHGLPRRMPCLLPLRPMKIPFFVVLAVAATVQPVSRQSPTAEISIAKSVQAGMPTDTASAFDASVGTVVGWSRVSGLAAGSTIIHLWIHGADSTRVSLAIGGSPWRTYSRKAIPAGASGAWTLEVLTSDGVRLGARTFRIG